jgi:hypothetical protein
MSAQIIPFPRRAERGNVVAFPVQDIGTKSADTPARKPPQVFEDKYDQMFHNLLIAMQVIDKDQP